MLLILKKIYQKNLFILKTFLYRKKISLKMNLEALLLGNDTIGRDYLQNFTTDFLHIDISTMQTFFSNTVEKIPVVKEVQVKSYVKSEKNRS